MQTVVKKEYMHLLGVEFGECNPLPLLREVQQANRYAFTTRCTLE